MLAMNQYPQDYIDAFPEGGRMTLTQPRVF
jgi:hypothetical protein